MRLSIMLGSLLRAADSAIAVIPGTETVSVPFRRHDIPHRAAAPAPIRGPADRPPVLCRLPSQTVTTSSPPVRCALAALFALQLRCSRQPRKIIPGLDED